MSQPDLANFKQTSVFDQEDQLINEQTKHQQQSKSSFCSRHGKLIFALIIIILIVALNHQSYFRISKQELDDSTKTLEPVLQIIVQDQKQKKTEKNQSVFQTIVPDHNQNQNLNALVHQLQANLTQQEKLNQQNQQKQQSVIQQSFQQTQNKSYPISEQSYNKRIYGGEIHYSRIPVQYWEHRILMVKAMGLNTLSVYVMWNYHQISKGKFDYQTQNKNITKFLELAIKHKMKVLLRPGPYICGEWDFGGLPARLLGINNLKIRSANIEYLKEVKIYFESLAPIIKPFLSVNKGPIHLIQIENELGSFSSDHLYTEALVSMWSELQIVSKFYIEDSSKQAYKNYFKGAAIGISGGTKNQDFMEISNILDLQADTLVFGGQIYTGWMTHWGQRWGGNPYHIFKKEIQYLFNHYNQFSLYVAHGGTNFGLTAGANAEMHNLSYEPMITSYDYDATITQQGRTTFKSDLIVELMKIYVRAPTIPFPDPIKTISFDQIRPKITASLLSNLGQPDLKQQAQLYYFQHPKLGMYNQGIVVYQTYISQGNYSMKLIIHDFALVFMDSHLIYTLIRIKTDIFEIDAQCGNEQCRILIVVQAMGHNNYGQQQQWDIKGLILCEINLMLEVPIEIKTTWDMYKLNINQSLFKMDKVSNKPVKHPAIFKQTFNLTQIGDTYIDMHKYRKGYVWVNGRNLGRYWNRGPQFRLYCPGVWLKKQNNQIVILQLLSSKEEAVSGKTELKEVVSEKTELKDHS